MFDLYKEKCEKSNQTPVKSSYYRSIFNTSFNNSFNTPKSDQYDQCEEIKIKKEENIPISEIERAQHEAHIRKKLLM